MTPLADLLTRDAQAGRVTWIGLRPARRDDVQPTESAYIGPDGLEGDHGRAGKRAVTLFQDEHLPVLGAFLGAEVTRAALRRNIHVAGLNLSSLRGAQLRIGAALLDVSGVCAPCSRMTGALGPGGYNAMRGHGGWCARVLEPGLVTVGDLVARA